MCFMLRRYISATMLIPSLQRRNHNQEGINLSFRSTSFKRKFSTTALIWSAFGLSVHDVMSMNSIQNRSKNRTKIESVSMDASMPLSDLFTSNGDTSRGSKNISSNLIWHHVTGPIGSTQDEIRKILQQHKVPNNKAIAVLADIQLDGRGTQGRRWERGDVVTLSENDRHQKDNNMYMTVGIPLDRIPVTITLLPLQIGVFVAERVSNLIELCQKVSLRENPANDIDNDKLQLKFPKVTVKWPNDVLVDQRKISGTLIETEFFSKDSTSWMLIGIGVNVASSPRNLMSNNRPGKHARPPCCIQDFCDASFGKIDRFHAERLSTNTAIVLGQDLASAIADWVFDKKAMDKASQEERLLQEWRSLAEWGIQYELRGRVVDEETGGYEGEKVMPVDIERDGQLRVLGADGRERLLVADYLF